MKCSFSLPREPLERVSTRVVVVVAVQPDCMHVYLRLCARLKRNVAEVAQIASVHVVVAKYGSDQLPLDC